MYILTLREIEPSQGQNYLKIDIWEDGGRRMEFVELVESPRPSHRGRKLLCSDLLCPSFR